MRFRGQMIKGTSLLLYAGPAVAGLAGYGWAMVPPFVAIFALWLAIRRPEHWPQTVDDWLSLRGALAASGQVSMQAVFVIACFVVGRSLGGVLGLMPGFHPIVPAVLSFAALPLLRLLWSPQAALAQAMVFDEIPEIRHPRLATVVACSAVDHLVKACDGADAARAELLLGMTLEAPDAPARLHRLAEVLAGSPADLHAPLRRALIGWATRPVAFAEGRGVPGAMQAAFAAAADCDDLLRYLLPRAVVLLHAAPARRGQFPEPAVLEDMARRCEAADVAGALDALAGLLSRLRPVPPLALLVGDVPRVPLVTA